MQLIDEGLPGGRRKVWIASRLEIARWWQAHHAEFKP